MRDLAQKGYSHEEVYNMLHGLHGARNIRFRFDVLDKDGNKKTELAEVVSGSVDMSAFADIKRTAKFRIREENYKREVYMTWFGIGEKDWSEI